MLLETRLPLTIWYLLMRFTYLSDSSREHFHWTSGTNGITVLLLNISILSACLYLSLPSLLTLLSIFFLSPLVDRPTERHDPTYDSLSNIDLAVRTKVCPRVLNNNVQNQRRQAMRSAPFFHSQQLLKCNMHEEKISGIRMGKWILLYHDADSVCFPCHVCKLRVVVYLSQH